jgi:hypothetical protein
VLADVSKSKLNSATYHIPPGEAELRSFSTPIFPISNPANKVTNKYQTAEYKEKEQCITK